MIGKTCFLGQPSACGVTHGSRNGLETELFQIFLGRYVIGTDISKTAPFFGLIQHEMHKDLPLEIVPQESLGFVFSNSWDHTMDPFLMFKAWAKSMHPRSIMITEKQRSSGNKPTASDPCAMTKDEIIDLVTKVRPDYDDHPLVYCGELQLNYFPKAAYVSDFGVFQGTATCLRNDDQNFIHLTDSGGNPRPLNHLIFARSRSESHLLSVRQAVHAINVSMNSRDLSVSEALFCLEPLFSSAKIDIRKEIVMPVLSRIVLGNALKSQVLGDSKTDYSGEDEIKQDLEFSTSLKQV